MKSIAAETKKRLKKARNLAAVLPSPLRGMSMEQAIQKIRKAREKLWEEKLAVHP